MFYVKLTRNGQDRYVLGTTWTLIEARAQRFPTREAALAALLRVRPFVSPEVLKIAQLIEVGA